MQECGAAVERWIEIPAPGGKPGDLEVAGAFVQAQRADVTPRLASLAACLAGLVFAILLFGAADRAEAHASFLASDPAAGLVTGEPPRTVVLRFNEPVVLTSARLTTPSGERFDLPLSSPAAAAHALAVPPQSEQGTYSLSWRVVSEDGHPVGGAFVYSVGRVSATLAVEAETPLAVRVLLWLSRLMTACGATFGVGGAAVLAFLAGNRGAASASRRTIDWALATGALGAAVSIGLQGLDAKGISLAGLTDVATWTTALVQTTWGTSALLNIAAVSAAALSGRRGSEVASRVLAGAAVAAVGAAFATSGHAATAPPETLSRLVVVLHAVAVTFWLGALPALLLEARAGGAGGEVLLRRFTQVIPYGLVLLFGSGLALALLQFRAPADLWTTAYGRVFILKFALFAGMLALAAANRASFAPAALAGSAAGRRRLVVSIAGETALAFGVLGVAGLWRFTPPPRAATPGAVFVAMHGEGASGRLSIRPPRAGPVSIVLDDFALPGGESPWRSR